MEPLTNGYPPERRLWFGLMKDNSWGLPLYVQWHRSKGGWSIYFIILCFGLNVHHDRVEGDTSNG